MLCNLCNLSIAQLGTLNHTKFAHAAVDPHTTPPTHEASDTFQPRARVSQSRIIEGRARNQLLLPNLRVNAP